MRKRLLLLLMGLMSVVMVQAQFAKPLKKNEVQDRAFSIGVTGCFAANDMIYSEVKKSLLSPMLAPLYGLAVEWNASSHFSVGTDVSYATRGGNEVFNIECLTSYSTSTFVREKYHLSLNGVEIRVPFSFYFGEKSRLRPYVYVAPRFCLWTGGNYHWERTYEDGSAEPLVYEGEVTQAMIRPYDLSAVAGAGLCGHLKMRQMQFFVKFDLGYGHSLLNTFSQAEVDGDVSFQGWGDMDGVSIGKRFQQNLEARLTLLVPLQKPAADACDFNQKPRRPKR